MAGSIRSGRVIEVLLRLISIRGAPRFLRSGNGPEFVSLALLKSIVEQGIECALTDPGKPWQNGATESFKGKFRDECLAMEWFRNRLKAKVPTTVVVLPPVLDNPSMASASSVPRQWSWKVPSGGPPRLSAESRPPRWHCRTCCNSFRGMSDGSCRFPL